MRWEKLFIFFGFVLILSLVSANFEIGIPSHFIEKQYAPGKNVDGWINISLSDEPVDSLFEDSFGNSRSLINLLKTSLDANYTCSPADCLPSYGASNPIPTKTFSLNAGAKKTIGIQITENISSVNSVTFNVESDAPGSCFNQLEIDFLKDNVVDTGNNNVSNLYCASSKNYGCFNTGASTSPAKIGLQSYCQKIILSGSSGFKLGAWVKEGIAGGTKLSMALYDLNRNYVTTCELPTASASGGEIDCDVNYSTMKSETHYLCLFHSGGSGGEYYIRGYSNPSSGCGYQGYINSPAPENYAYQIFAKGKKFSAMGNLEISNTLPKGDTISRIVEEYIWRRYSEEGCSSGCVVPIEFTSRVNQNLILKNLSVSYGIGGGLVSSTDKFYDVSESPSVVNSEFQMINLDGGNFSVTSEYGEVGFELSLDGEEIFSEEITIKEAPLIKNLNPKTTAVIIPTEFKVFVNSSNITEYKWDFGDGTNSTTIVNKVVHTYEKIGVYELKITITDKNQLSSSRIFKIEVSSSKQAINSTLEKKLSDLNNIDLQMKQSQFEQNLKSVLNFDTLDVALNKIKQDYKKASSDNDYNKIMVSLLGLEIPESVNIVSSATLITFYPEKSKVNLNVMKEIGGGNYESKYEDEYSDALLAWNQKNMDTKVTFSEFSANYGYFDERPILRTFKFKINKKNNSDDSYLVLAKLEGIEFKEDYSVKEKSGYLYIELEQESETIMFTTTEEVNFVDVPVFISPKLGKLKIVGSIGSGRTGKGAKWILFIFILFLLALAGFGGYIILQEWYKRKYEVYLFKKRNDLYNLMIYLTEGKKRGSSGKEMHSKLKKAGWNSEQVNYALRKHSGKRTGMFELISLGKKKQKSNNSRLKK